MKRWHVGVRYLDAHRFEHWWESNVDADTAESAKIAGEGSFTRSAKTSRFPWMLMPNR